MKKNTEVQIKTLIGSGSVCDGDFTASGSARIDGRINGDLTVDGTLIIGAGGYVGGNIVAAAAVIGGEVNGDIEAPERVELIDSAKVIGNIKTKVIVIDEKAIFQGSMNMYQETDKVKKPSLRTVKKTKKSAKAAIEEALKEVKDVAPAETPAVNEAVPTENIATE